VWGVCGGDVAWVCMKAHRGYIVEL